MQCCYHFKASEQLQFGVDLEGSLLQRDINATFAYQAQIPKSDINIKGIKKKSNFFFCNIFNDGMHVRTTKQGISWHKSSLALMQFFF